MKPIPRIVAGEDEDEDEGVAVAVGTPGDGLGRDIIRNCPEGTPTLLIVVGARAGSGGGATLSDSTTSSQLNDFVDQKPCSTEISSRIYFTAEMPVIVVSLPHCLRTYTI
jgi:hypothetical protein